MTGPYRVNDRPYSSPFALNHPILIETSVRENTEVLPSGVLKLPFQLVGTVHAELSIANASLSKEDADYNVNDPYC